MCDELVKELAGVITLTQVIYGDTHWKLAWAHINLAQVYLEQKRLAKQAKHHCELAWAIYLEDLKDRTRRGLFVNTTAPKDEKNVGVNGENEQDDESDADYYNPDADRHQMILNYLHGRACTILKE